MMSLGIVILEEFSKGSSGSSERANQFDSERAGQAHKSLFFGERTIMLHIDENSRAQSVWLDK